MSNPQNRRDFWRAPFRVPAQLIDASGTWEAKLCDISLKGALVELPAGWPGLQGGKCRMRLELAPGVAISMEATVDIHDQSGPSSSSTTAVDEAGKQQVVTSTRVFDDLDKAVDERVNAIVSANLGHRVHLKRAD